MARLERTAPASDAPIGRRSTILTDQAIATTAALAIAAAAGLLTAFVAPRGPTTTVQALLVMALGLLVGLIAGSFVRSRWVFVLVGLAYMVGVELGRLDGVVPTIGAPRFDTPYGILAFVLTRGVHGLLVLLPMALGVLLGIALASRLGWSSPPASTRRPLGTTLLGLVVLGLAVLVALPASTPPVTGPGGAAVPGSIAELTSVRLGGSDQAVMIRAADPDDPVLLYLSGGPGQSDLALARAQVGGWEHEVVFVDLDQRGNGKSYAALDPLSSLTLDQAVSDVVELTDYLRTRFDEQKIYLMGESWGTILGVLAVQRRPDLYHAWIGSGQMVDVVETDGHVYDDLVAFAGRTGDAALSAKLVEIGRPPYADIPWANANLLAWYEYLYEPYTPSAGYMARGEASGLDPFGVLGSEYAFIEKTTVLRGLIDTFALLYPQLYDLDLRESVPRLDVPVFQLDGAAELDGRRSLALAWFEGLEAPSKQLVTFEGAAHAVAFEQADAVQQLLTETIIPSTYGR
jgi:pimeloyl-ACP methyl ester carboxylesterase